MTSQIEFNHWTTNTEPQLDNSTDPKPLTRVIKLHKATFSAIDQLCHEHTDVNFRNVLKSRNFHVWMDVNEEATSLVNHVTPSLDPDYHIHPLENPTFLPETASSKKPHTYLSSRQQISYQRRREEVSTPTRAGKSESKPVRTLEAFHERVDRYGNTYGAREPEPQGYNSPPYTKRRDQGLGRHLQNQNSFPQRELSEWRAKPPTLPTPSAQSGKMEPEEPQNYGPQKSQIQTKQVSIRYQSEEQVMKDLNDATLRYLSCPDPTEVNARRQREMQEEAATEIMKACGQPAEHVAVSTLEQQKTQAITEEQVMQELHEVILQYLCCADPVEAAARRQRVLESDAEGLMETTAASIVAASTEQRRSLSPWERDTPPPIQIREKKKQKRGTTLKCTIVTPNILNGISSRKRNISQMRFSPGRGKKSPQNKKHKGATSKDTPKTKAGTSKAVICRWNPQTVPKSSNYQFLFGDFGEWFLNFCGTHASVELTFCQKTSLRTLECLCSKSVINPGFLG
ncbi:hypothetical protein YC2023_020462 [Brassica napus]